MAQKIFPRSLRSGQLLSQDYSFYSENHYSKLWAKGYEVLNFLFSFSQKNLLYKGKRKGAFQKRPGKRKKIPSFLQTRFYLSNILGLFQCSPILFKFVHGSLAKKYNPMINKFKVRRSSKKTSFFLKKKMVFKSNAKLSKL